MLDKLTGALAHVIGLALVCAIAAYWLIRIATPAPSVAPAAMSPPPPRDPDPVLAARMFGKVQTNDAAPSNLQLVGVFAAGRQSAAAISVDGRPARVFLLDQSVTNDLKLHAVDGEGAQLVNPAGAVQTIRVPRQAVAQFATQVPANDYSFDRGMMTAPSVEGPATTAPTGGTSRRGQIPRDAQEIQPQVSVGAPPPQPLPPPSPVQQLTPPQPQQPQPQPAP
jgi:general secretion pathway protein C